MPKKSNHLKTYKFNASSYTGSSTASSSSGPSQNTEKPSKSVNELLANLRRTSLGPGSLSHSLPANSPSVPPVIGQILQIPTTPEPAPRRPVRLRDDRGRRLPAGPPPPRSWTSRGDSGDPRQDQSSASVQRDLNSYPRAYGVLPGVFIPEEGSLVELALQSMAARWDSQKKYDHVYLYQVPSHIKPALIRSVGMRHNGVSLGDLKLLLAAPRGDDATEEPTAGFTPNADIYSIDLTGSPGHSIRFKELFSFLFPSAPEGTVEDVKDSWDAPEITTNPPQSLLPNLTHLSLALYPHQSSNASWRQLLLYASRLSTVTHLSLANWSVPCLTPRARDTTVVSPQGQRLAYSGTNMYSHTLDHDWSEALLVLRMLSKSLYKLEFLDLTGCGPWFSALVAESEHDRVDWVGSWGKITTLRMFNGWAPDSDSMPSHWEAYRGAITMAITVEKHIRTRRAGKGRFITVERDRLDE